MTDQRQSNSPWWRRYARFSVRGLVVLVLVCGGGMGWLVRRRATSLARSRRSRPQAAMSRTNGNGTTVVRSQTARPWWPKWLSDRVGVDYLASVARVEIFFFCSDKEMIHIGRLGWTDTLSLPCTRVSDAGLAQLHGLSRLRTLNLWGNKITDAGLVHLKGLTRLRWLCLDQTAVTDSGLKQLAGLRNLETLSLEHTRCTDGGAQELARALPRLKIIR